MDARASCEEVLSALDALDEDPAVHGGLLFRPLPEYLKPPEQEICNRLLQEKDVDGMTGRSAAGVGAVTSTVLMKHVVRAAEKAAQ